MDRALSKYQGTEDPGRWIADALELAERCRETEGLWVGLWHPNLTAPLGFPGAFDAFQELVAAIMSQQPFTGVLSDLVTWRRARRSVRAVRVGERGPELRASHGTRWPLELEDARGRVVISQPWPARS
jgi:hypothetical protein